MIYGIDVNVLTRENRTGTERYVFELLKEMMRIPLKDNEKVLLYVSKSLDEFEELPRGWEVKVLEWKFGKLWTHIRLSWELWRRTPDVFFSPAHEIPLFYGRAKIVSTVHDVAFARLKDVYSPKGRRRQNWAVKRATKLAKHLLTVSQVTKDDLIKLYKVEAEKMTVSHLAVNRAVFNIDKVEIDRVMQKYRLGKGTYFLSIGRVEKKKNIITLISAFEQLKIRRGIGDASVLVLAGSFGFGGDEIKQKIATSSARDFIRVAGYVPESDLAGLMKGALAYVFPSYYEGFGIPALEAMASGVPLIASDIPALREVAGDAALFASPYHAPQWTQTMLSVLLKKINIDDLIEKGRKRVGEFDWSRTAQKTWEVLRNM